MTHTLGLPSPQCTTRETEAQADDVNPSRASLSQGHGWAVGDTQSLAEQARPPPPALLPTVKGTLWGQKATYCVTGDKAQGTEAPGAWAGHGATCHPLPAQRVRLVGKASRNSRATHSGLSRSLGPAAPDSAEARAWTGPGPSLRWHLLPSAAPLPYPKSGHVSYQIQPLGHRTNSPEDCSV